MLLNKQPEQAANVQISLNNFTPQSPATLYRYDSADPHSIVKTAMPVEHGQFRINLPPYSITLLVMAGK
jgi:hypothetical protein